MSPCHLGSSRSSASSAPTRALVILAMAGSLMACSAGVDTDEAPEFSGTAGSDTAPGQTPSTPDGSMATSGVNAGSGGSASPVTGAGSGSSPSGAASGASTGAPSTSGETPPVAMPPGSDPGSTPGGSEPEAPGETPVNPAPGGGRFGLGGESRCASGGFSICEGFESAAVGTSAVAGWLPAGYGARTLRVVDTERARGGRALQVEIAENQGAVVAMLSHGNLGALGVRHFGRSFLKIEAPAPTGFVHFDVFEARGDFGGQDNLVRWASTGTNVGSAASNWSWIYNVQSTDHGEFGSEGPRSAHPREGDWMCLEWLMDSAAQEAQFWFDGAEVDYLHIDTERAEIPAFESFNIGFQKFQQTGAWRVWVDEVAFGAERIGCDG